jgi:hypothetical protein
MAPVALATGVSGRTCLRRMTRIGAAAACAAAVMVPLHAAASIGTGVGANPIVLTEVAQPGHSYTLPQLYIVNTGTEASPYGVRVTRLEKGSQRDVPNSWVELPRSPIVLAAGEATRVPVRLLVPAGAAPGDYMTNLVAGTVAPGRTSGTSLGAAAATQLRFSVASVDAGFQWPVPFWVDLLLIAGTLAASAMLLARRAGLRLHVERRRGAR